VNHRPPTPLGRSVVPATFAPLVLWASPLLAQPPPAAPTTPPAHEPAPAPSANAPSAIAPAGTPEPKPAEVEATAPAPDAPSTGDPGNKGKHEGEHGKKQRRHEKDLAKGHHGSKAPSLGGDKAPSAALNERASRDYGHIELHGRVFARVTLSTREVPGASPSAPKRQVKALDLSLPSARIGFQYQSPLKWLAAETEAELAGKPRVKDAYARAQERYITVKAGQFKVPISALALEAAFSLPTVDRGLLDDLLKDAFLVGGRRIGMSAELHDREAKNGLRPTFTLGAFQGSTLDQGSVRDLEGETLGAQSYAARAELHPGPLTFGLSFEHRTGPEVALRVPDDGRTPALTRPAACASDACTTHYYTVGADAALDLKLGGGGLRLWLDGLAGRSWFESARKRLAPDRALDASFPIFGSLRAVAAFRFGGKSRRDLYVEPYGMAGVLDPDLSYGRDHVTEWALGVNVGRWKLARVGLEGDVDRGAARLPTALGGDPDRMSLRLQAAVIF
jgi:hypothetical protein